MARDLLDRHRLFRRVQNLHDGDGFFQLFAGRERRLRLIDIAAEGKRRLLFLGAAAFFFEAGFFGVRTEARNLVARFLPGRAEAQLLNILVPGHLKRGGHGIGR